MAIGNTAGKIHNLSIGQFHRRFIMQVNLYGMSFLTEGITFYLWSPWRCMAIEHRLFEAIRVLPGTHFKQEPDEISIEIESEKTWKLAREAVERTLKGWQEEASDAGGERRAWRWLMEADTDADGYDMNGDPACFWVYLRALVERGGPDDGEKAEEIDFNGFGMSFRTTNADEEE